MTGFLVCAEECDQCLFSDKRIVSSARMKQELTSAQRNDTFFVCHKASIAEHGEQVACAGWHKRFSCNLSRIAERLGAVRFVNPETLETP